MSVLSLFISLPFPRRYTPDCPDDCHRLIIQQGRGEDSLTPLFSRRMATSLCSGTAELPNSAQSTGLTPHAHT